MQGTPNSNILADHRHRATPTSGLIQLAGRPRRVLRSKLKRTPETGNTAGSYSKCKSPKGLATDETHLPQTITGLLQIRSPTHTAETVAGPRVRQINTVTNNSATTRPRRPSNMLMLSHRRREEVHTPDSVPTTITDTENRSILGRRGVLGLVTRRDRGLLPKDSIPISEVPVVALLQ